MEQETVTVNKIYETIGRRVREFRTRHGATLEELASAARLTPSFVGQIERGERKLSVEALGRLSAALRIPPCELMSDKDRARELPRVDRVSALVSSLSPKDRDLLCRLLKVVLRDRR